MIGTFGPYMSPSSSADATAALRQRHRKIHGHGGLSHPALAGAHRDDVLDALDGLPSELRPAHARTCAVIFNLDSRHSRQRSHGRSGLLAQQILHGTRGRGQLDAERHGAVAILRFFTNPSATMSLCRSGSFTLAERIEHCRLGYWSHQLILLLQLPFGKIADVGQLVALTHEGLHHQQRSTAPSQPARRQYASLPTSEVPQ
jgi:hypothetical protein